MNTTPEVWSARVEVRAAEDFCLEGIAAGYGTTAVIGGAYRETVASGAFTQSLRDNVDVRCLLNHSADMVLGRSKYGTLKLTDTAKGLAFRCQLDRNNSQHRDVYAQVQRGDLDACSFAFYVPDGGDTWDYSNKALPLRTLRNVKLVDVSIVTFPAYSDGTSVDARHAKDWDEARRVRCREQGEKIDADNRRRCRELGELIAKNGGR